MSDVNQILAAVEQGDAGAADQLFPLVYDELRRLAAGQKLAREAPGRSINLAGTPIPDDGLKHLNRLATLETLDLSGTQISDAGLEHLKGLCGLRELGLKNTTTTDAGVDDLRRRLPGLSRITR